MHLVAISEDEKHIASASKDRTLRISKKDRGEYIGDPLRGYTVYMNPLTVTSSGRHIISDSQDETFPTWKMDAGRCVREPLS